jgi:hypothetical protein
MVKHYCNNLTDIALLCLNIKMKTQFNIALLILNITMITQINIT